MIKPGFKVIALKSSGCHSNGYTDIRLNLLNGDFETRPEFRRRYRGRFSLHDKFGSATIGQELLKPTRIYLRTVNAISKEFSVLGFNNTGYGLKNLNRAKEKVEFRITGPLKPQPIFELLQKESGFSDEEMYRKFNMGQGFFLVCRPEDASGVINIAQKFGDDAKVVGEVRKSDVTKVVLEKNGKEIEYVGY